MNKIYKKVTNILIILLFIVTVNGIFNNDEQTKTIINISALVIIILLALISWIIARKRK